MQSDSIFCSSSRFLSYFLAKVDFHLFMTWLTFTRRFLAKQDILFKVVEDSSRDKSLPLPTLLLKMLNRKITVHYLTSHVKMFTVVAAIVKRLSF